MQKIINIPANADKHHSPVDLQTTAQLNNVVIEENMNMKMNDVNYLHRKIKEQGSQNDKITLMFLFF